MLIAVIIGLGLWIVAVVYGFGVGTDRIRTARLQASIRPVLLVAVFWPVACLVILSAGFLNGLRPRRPKEQLERLGDMLEAGSFLALGLYLLVIGSALLVAVLPGGTAAALICGPVFLGTAFWLLRRYRRNWARFAAGGHRREVLLHLAGIPALTAIGILILVFGL